MHKITVLVLLLACGGNPPADSLDSLLGVRQREDYQNFIDEATFSRHRSTTFPGALELYNHLMDHPPLVARSMIALALASFTVEDLETGRWTLTESEGLQGVMTYWGGSPRRRIYHIKAAGPGPFGWRVSGEALFDMTSEPVAEGLHQELTAHVRVDGWLGVLLQLLEPFLAQAVDARLDLALGGGRELTRRLAQDSAATLNVLRENNVFLPGERVRLETILGKSGKLRK